MEFGRSLFERLVSLKHTPHLLNTQYRMHPMISKFPNKEFYGGRIVDGPNVIKSSYKKQFLEGDMFGSFSFIHLTQGKVEFDNKGSGKNMVEVAVIVELLARLDKGASFYCYFRNPLQSFDFYRVNISYMQNVWPKIKRLVWVA